VRAGTPGVDAVLTARSGEVAAGFMVRRLLPSRARRTVGPFIFFDHIGPVTLDPGHGLVPARWGRYRSAARAEGRQAHPRKPSAVIGTSPGKIGTVIGQQHLRSILASCHSPQVNSVEAHIQSERGLITEDGQVTNPPVQRFLRDYTTEFHGFIARVSSVLPRDS
jgi:hypothetical protein